MAVEQYQEGHDPSVAPPTVADVFGTLAAYLIFLALAQFLWIDLVEMPSKHRAVLLVGLALLGLRGAASGIGPDGSGRPRAPGTARALGLLSWVIFGLALFELGRAFHLPSSGWSQVVMGGAALFAAQALSHGVLALMGAAMVESNLAALIALRLGLVGSWMTNALFVNMAVGLGQLLVGRWRIRVGARTSGVALVGWGGFTVLSGAYMLSLHGGGYLGLPDTAPLRWGLGTFLVLLCLGMMRLGRRTGSVLLQVTASLMLFFRCLIWYVDFFGGLTERAIYLGLGLLFLLLAFRADRGPGEPGEGPPEPRPEGGPSCRRFGLATARRMMLVLVAAAALRGAYNMGGPQRETIVPIEGQVMPPVVFLQIPPTAVNFPPGFSPGDRLDVHVEFMNFFAEEAMLVPTKMVATAPGDPAPESFDVERTVTLPGTLVRGRMADGGEFQVVLPEYRFIMEVPREMAFDAVAGRHLVLRTGRAGIMYPYALRKPGGGGDLVAELRSWLLGRAPP